MSDTLHWNIVSSRGEHREKRPHRAPSLFSEVEHVSSDDESDSASHHSEVETVLAEVSRPMSANPELGGSLGRTWKWIAIFACSYVILWLACQPTGVATSSLTLSVKNLQDEVAVTNVRLAALETDAQFCSRDGSASMELIEMIEDLGADSSETRSWNFKARAVDPNLLVTLLRKFLLDIRHRIEELELEDRNEHPLSVDVEKRVRTLEHQISRRALTAATPMFLPTLFQCARLPWFQSICPKQLFSCIAPLCPYHLCASDSGLEVAIASASYVASFSPDYAQLSGGGRIWHTVTSESYSTSTTSSRFLGSFTPWIKHGAYSDPEYAIHTESTLGTCWGHKGYSGRLGIQLLAPIRVLSVTVEHPPEVRLNPASAPREMQLWGMVEGKDDFMAVQAYHRGRPSVYQPWRSSLALDPTHQHLVKGLVVLASFSYDIQWKYHIQTFPVMDEVRQLNLTIQRVIAVVLNNWGNSDHTVLCRIRVHGVH
ncbi:hypothetical protein SISSUDRAFT_1067845 [Sistotremastrum suecicum HHB10207 ss-3]|uniref:SUN domain-containing protein n=1 Tax=Sistotremastrum suecicum HHB10207 ss-3 TaxID=1314776 RepID=A0A165WMJ7_9AGAM|nr:hypothetical protein SISSUDRAFT_1067845 [Sistotremastrum suecicum HHB10207 ss-3]